MALALDASTPSRITGTTNPATTAAFSPPASTLLIAIAIADFSETFVVSGGGLTWTQIGTINNGSSDAVAVSWAWNANAQSNITVSSTRTGSFTANSIKVLVFTGAESTYGGATASGAAGSVNVTTTRANSWVWAGFGDDNASPAATAISGCAFNDADVTYGGTAGGILKVSSTTPASGTVVSIGATGSPNPSLFAVEIREPAGAAVITRALASYDRPMKRRLLR